MKGEYCDEHKASVRENVALKERIEALESTRNQEWPRFWAAINARLKATLVIGLFVSLVLATAGAWANLAGKISSMEVALTNRLTTIETKLAADQARRP